MTRRSPQKLLASLVVLACVALGSGVSSVTASAAAAKECRPSVAGLDLQTVTIPQLQKALATGKTTSVELVRAYLARIAAYDGHVNSIRALNPNALKTARKLDAKRGDGTSAGLGPLHGIPVLLKDNINTTDMPTTAGSIALKGSIPLEEATITTKLEKAGAIILGKTNLSEFANWMSLGMPNGYSSLGGQVKNPYTMGDPSGSSSGSGVAGAMAFATGTVGTETSGSILSPSVANSLVGIKPTTGLLSRYGILPLAPSFDTPGPMTRNVTDAAVLLGAMAGVDEMDERTADSGDAPSDYSKFLDDSALKDVRLGYSSDDRGVLFDAALEVLEKQGATLVETDTLSNTSLVGLTEIGLIPNEFKASLNQYLAELTPETLRVRTLSDIIEYNEQHPDKVKYGQNLLIASDATPGVYHPATAEPTIQTSRATIDATLLADDLDAIVAPGNTYANISAAAGYPTVVVPAGYTGEGRGGFGLSFLADGFSEPRLISYAYDYEQATKLRIPPTESNAILVPKGCG